MILRDIPMFRIGHLMLNFGGADANGEANFVPFKTILPYLFGYKGLIIAGINIVGNIVLLIPVGLLVPLVYRNIAWKGAFLVAVAYGLVIEGVQVVLRTGIFDVDDVILNGFGVMVGYWISISFLRWMKPRRKMS